MSSAPHRIAVIPGDGIGGEVIAEALRVLDAVRPQLARPVEAATFDWGAERWLRDGTTLPAGAVEELRTSYQAILFGGSISLRLLLHQLEEIDVLTRQFQIDVTFRFGTLG